MFWIVGTTRDNELALVEYEKTGRGWKQRSATRGLNRDYVSKETYKDIMEWFDVDFSKRTEFDSKEAALKVMGQIQTLL